MQTVDVGRLYEQTISVGPVHYLWRRGRSPAEESPQPCHVHPQRRVHTGRRGFTPQYVDQLVSRDCPPE